jgi:caa(3)-type oxidase subunit IV
MSDSAPHAFRSQVRRSLCVFAVVVCGTFLMVGASFLSLPSRTYNIALVLAAAAVNATLVATFLMHLLSEKKMIYSVLLFTAIFCVALMALTLGAHTDVPPMTTH